MQNIKILKYHREAKDILKTPGLKRSLYRLALRVIDDHAPHPYQSEAKQDA